MKRIWLMAVLSAVLLCGCQAGGAAERADYADSVSKAQEIAVIAGDNPEVIAVLTGAGEIKDFVCALRMDDWEPGELPSGIGRTGAFALSQEATILLGETGTDGIMYDIGKITAYDGPYVSFEVLGVSMGFTVPEATAAYLNGYFDP